MAVNFTDAEKELLSNQRLGESQLPSYFSSSSFQLVPISRDFEAYLILQSTEDKQLILEWIQNVNDIQTDTLDRDNLLERYFGHRSTDATARIADIDETLGEFDNIRKRLLNVGDIGEDPSRWPEVEEVSALIQSLQRPIDELGIQRDEAFHENTMVTVLRTEVTNKNNTDASQTELQSWQNVISTYPGQEGASTEPGSSLIDSIT